MRGSADPSSSNSDAQVRVTVLPHSAALRAGVPGLLLQVQRTGGSAKAGSPRISVDYSSFRGAYGGNWASRLHLVTLPACALSHPSRAACRTQRPVDSVNDAKATTVTAQVPLPKQTTTSSTVTPFAADSTTVAQSAPAALQVTSAAAVVAVTASPSGGGGNFAATKLSPSGSWSAGGSSGAFTYAYPIDLPPVPGDLTPDVALSYDSSSVDGRTSSTNNQASWVGDGWDYSPGFIQRSFTSCADDGVPANSDGIKPADLCWSDDNELTISLGSKTTKLVKDDTTGTWHLQDDDGEKVEFLTGASNGDHAGDYWRITTQDGTQYYYGLNHLPGWASGDAATNSTWTVPVYGNNSGEPCYNADFAKASCSQAWRWNLDYVVDTHSDVISYFYSTEANYYGADLGTAPVPYIRGGTLAKIQYGQRDGAVYTTTPAGQVTFTTAERCDPSGGFDCSTATLSSTTAAHWPDVPYDQSCPSSGVCDNHAPTFWTTKELTGISTQALKGSTLEPVDSYALSHTFPATGDTTTPSLWLSGITRTGQDGTNLTLPAMTFTGTGMPNRVGGSQGLPAIVRQRLTSISTESGETITVAYAGAQCSATDEPTSPAADTMACFGDYWTPPGELTPILDYFNTYPVTQVVEQDGTTNAPPVVTNYTYLGTPAWRYDDDPLTESKYRTWDIWRGYGQVETRTGQAPDPITLTRDTYFRGLDGNRQSDGSTASVSVTDSRGGSVTDTNELAGTLFEEIEYDGDGGSQVSDTITDPWISAATATQTRTGATSLVAHMVDASSIRAYEPLSTGGTRETEEDFTHDSLGRITQEDDQGDVSTASDDLCTKTTYADNTSEWLLDLPAHEQTYVGRCSSTPTFPADAVSDEENFYDGSTTLGAAPTHGDATTTKDATSVAADGTPDYVTTQTATFDEYGRQLTDTDADGNTTKTTFSPATGAEPTVSVETDPLNHVTVSYFDPARDLLTETYDPNRDTTYYAYDALGRLTSLWEPGHPKTGPADATYSYDISKTAPSTVETNSIEDDGKTYSTSIDIYDSLLRQRQSQDPSPGGGRVITDTEYDSHGWVTKTSDPYYATGLPSTTLVTPQDSAVPSQSGYVYDGDGRQTKAIDYSLGNETSETDTTYNGADATTIKPPTGTTPTTIYTDARGNKTALLQYHAGAPVDPSDPASDYDKTTYTSTPAGQPASITDAAGNTWTYHYDLLGDQTSATDPDTGTTTSTYDPAGNLTSATDANGTTLTFTYDKLGRQTAEYDTTGGQVPNSVNEKASWLYDTLHKGQLTSSTRYVGGSTGAAYTVAAMGYDAMDRPTGTTYTLPSAAGKLAGTYSFKQGWTYTGNAAGITDPAMGGLPTETVNYGYDALGNITSAKGIDAYISNASYTELSDPMQYTFGTQATGAQLSLYYDEQTRNLTRAITTTAHASSAVDDTRYTYDASSNVTSTSDVEATTDDAGAVTSTATDTQCYRYDYLQRLTEAWTAKSDCTAAPSVSTIGGPAPYWQSWTFDVTGNRLSQTNHDVTGDTSKDQLTTYAYPKAGASQPHTLTKSTTTTGSDTQESDYTYDKDGNTTSVTTRSGTKTLTWDDEGNLASVAQSGAAAATTYLYDADGNLLIRNDPNGTSTAYLGDTELAVDSSGILTGTRYYTLGDDGPTIAVRQGDGEDAYLIPDRQGTDTLQIDANTLAVTRRQYTPYGEARTGTSGDTNTPWIGDKGYVGGINDANTGFETLGARQYDPTTGRFLSVDPLLDALDPQQMNGYTYANDNPTTNEDPNGKFEYNPGTNLQGGSDQGLSAYQKRVEAEKKHWAAVARARAAAARAARIRYLEWLYRNRNAANRTKKLLAERARAKAKARARAKARAHAKAVQRRNAAERAREAARKKIHTKPPRHRGHGGGISNFLKHTYESAKKHATRAITAGVAGATAVAAGTTAVVAGGASAIASAGSGVVSALAGAAGLCKSNSFPATTLVLLANGHTEAIADIHTGSLVEATDPQTGVTEPKSVTNKIVTYSDYRFTDLTIESKTGRHTITSTQHHPYWDASTQKWTNASNLHVGDHLRTATGTTTATIAAVRNYNRHIITYNLTVANLHTYYIVAGETSLLVHNSGCDEWAAAFAKKYGGDIHTFDAGGAPSLGDYKLEPNESWAHHTVVVKDGRVFDQYTGPDGILVDEWKKLWSERKYIDFGF